MAKIVVKNIKKYYKNTKALNGVSLEVKEGDVLGLLGPNGAGKTTLVNVLTTLLKPDSGKATIAGLDVVKDAEKLRTKIGLAGQFAAVDGNLTGRENLEMVARLYHLGRAEAKKRALEVLERIDLIDAMNRPAKTYSGGMRRRLDLGASLLYRPEVLFLDEPTTGLDPKTRLDLWGLIQEMVNDGTTLLLTTQYLEEADRLADKIVVINHGKVVAEGTSKQLKKKLSADKLQIELEKPSDTVKAESLLEQAKLSGNGIGADPKTGTLTLSVDKGIQDLQKALSLLEKGRVGVTHVDLSQPSLDDVFLKLTEGKKKR